MPHRTLLPPGWAPPIGYANGIAADASRIVFIAGQVGWDARQRFVRTDFVSQFDQALANVLDVLAQAGGRPEHVCRITAYCCDKPAYLAARAALGEVWRKRMGKHYPAMSMIFVADLLDHPAVIELEATAVVPSAA
ncbi:RidA family protein [Betaproteobacteria bacterium PRO7]|jgi:enamine deaminase RidA (YjgF/YER057c/UK114 family)|nr:RidA family protein [Burkholderiaceae bacterium]MDL1860763.1 RidA family protein [Betaproteobacteria bacterium PRO7]GIL06804.1 MAG: enamine deaminase RidA [Betaproteobacteria bacterium]